MRRLGFSSLDVFNNLQGIEFHAVTPFTPLSLLDHLWIAGFEKLGSEEAAFFSFGHLGFKLRYGLDFLFKVAME
jgi:hypothetical protein